MFVGYILSRRCLSCNWLSPSDFFPFIIWCCVYSTDSFRVRWSIGDICNSFSSNRKYQTLPLLSNFSMVVCLMLLYYHILLVTSYQRKAGFLFPWLLHSLCCVKIIGYTIPWLSYSFVCILHYISIIITQTCLKALDIWNAWQVYIFCRVVCV